MESLYSVVAMLTGARLMAEEIIDPRSDPESDSLPGELLDVIVEARARLLALAESLPPSPDAGGDHD